MLLGVIADDFTGASDIGNTLARGGLATTQFLGVPTASADKACEAGVVALKTRSISAPDAVAQSLAALEWLRAQGCRQFVFKYCSTFDSTPEGNIGPVGEALARALGVSGVVACPAFPAAGRTVYQGHLFVGDRLLSESSMKDHPLNPMTDSDLRRWLRRQTTEAVGLVSRRTASASPTALRTALDACADRGERLVIVDAVRDRDLLTIAEACADSTFITGASGVALGLPANFVKSGLAKGGRSTVRGIDGPAAILAGSCSARTMEQVEWHLASFPSLAVDITALLEGRLTAARAVEFVLGCAGEPLVFSTTTPSEVAAIQRVHGIEHVAAAVESFFAEVARGLVAGGIKRLVVAGGETSGAVVSALGIRSLEIGPEIDPGVPALFSREGEGLGLVLKSGNFGTVDFFGKATAALR
jgi:uncharacterized protein YgbK (DUF1537 family)